MKAETIVKKHWNLNYDEDHNPCYYENECILMMQEFAKYHVQKALKAALDSIPCLGSSSDIASYDEVEEAVLNSYPLEKIK